MTMDNQLHVPKATFRNHTETPLSDGYPLPTELPCDCCGNETIELVNSKQSALGFREVYECSTCGATGTVTGTASESPQTYEKHGDVFDL
jgi:hypothetical protein